MVRKLIGLILQILSIYCIGNSIALQILLESKGLGISFLFLGIALWTFSYFILHDLNESKISKEK